MASACQILQDSCANVAGIATFDIVIQCITMQSTGLHTLITSFLHKGLGKFFQKGDYSGIPAAFSQKIERILDRLDGSSKPEDMSLPGYKFHPMTGSRKGTYSVTVTGNWRITFRFDGENAIDVNYEDYH